MTSNSSKSNHQSTEQPDPRARELLGFWFADLLTQFDEAKSMQLWFGGAPELDATCRARFGSLLAEAEAGGLKDWEAQPESLLALVILLDQISRNVHRGKGAAFANDARALALAKQAVARGWAEVMHPLQQLFLYLPYEHSEKLADQQTAVSLFEALEATVEPELRQACAGYTDYARRHREVIARFGRFPGRNQRLGRASTPEELAFLSQPGSSFG